MGTNPIQPQPEPGRLRTVYTRVSAFVALRPIQRLGLYLIVVGAILASGGAPVLVGVAVLAAVLLVATEGF